MPNESLANKWNMRKNVDLKDFMKNLKFEFG
jgi:hypothetical protein